jgi:hypothetical protein
MPPDRRSGPPVTTPDSRSYDPPAAKQAKSLANLHDGSDRRKLAEVGTDRPRRCAHLFPALTGCREHAEPGSWYCAAHGET